jgi:copper(I)-binding protein
VSALVTSRRIKIVAATLVIEALLAVGLIWVIRPSSSLPANLTQHSSKLAPGIVVSAVTVTTAHHHENSAVRLTIANGTNEAIILNSVSTPLSRRAMLHYDVNMCGTGSSMTPMPNVEIGAHEVAHLGYRGLGAMLINLNQPWTVGSHIELDINRHDYHGRNRTMQVIALVVSQPPHLQYVSATSMAGMSM